MLVMAKAPVPGRVKTRLCPPCDPVEAAGLAEAALADTLEAVAWCGASRRLLALDGQPGDWLPPGFTVFRQSGSSFGERLARAWARAGGPGLQIGMDTPQVTGPLLDGLLGRMACGSRSTLLGPAEDGGWWALGLPVADPEVFRGVPMSTGTTGARQRRRLQELGYAVEEVETLRDVDSIEDARAVAAVAPESRFAAALQGLRLESGAGRA